LSTQLVQQEVEKKGLEEEADENSARQSFGEGKRIRTIKNGLDGGGGGTLKYIKGASGVREKDYRRERVNKEIQQTKSKLAATQRVVTGRETVWFRAHRDKSQHEHGQAL